MYVYIHIQTYTYTLVEKQNKDNTWKVLKDQMQTPCNRQEASCRDGKWSSCISPDLGEQLSLGFGFGLGELRCPPAPGAEVGVLGLVMLIYRSVICIKLYCSTLEQSGNKSH